MASSVRKLAAASSAMPMNSLPRWLISITDMPLPCQSSISAAACCSTGAGSTAGPALKLKTRMRLFRRGGMNCFARSVRGGQSIGGSGLLYRGRERRVLLLLRLRRNEVVLLRMAPPLPQQAEPHRTERALPQLARGLALADEAPVLRRDRAGIHALSQVIDRAAGDGIALANGPLDGGEPAMPGEQRRVVTDAAEARARERGRRNARVAVGGHDEIDAVRDGAPRNDAGVFLHPHVYAGFDRCRRETIVGGRDDHPTGS